MKRVFSNSQCCHVFISQSQPDGRNSKSSIYFHGDTIWSYGSHYVMGKIYKDVLLVNENAYSSATGGHRGHLVRAAEHLKVIYVPDPTNTDSSANLEYLSRAALYSLTSIFTARFITSWCIESLNENVKDHNDFIDCFNLDAEKIEIDQDTKDLIKEFKATRNNRNLELNATAHIREAARKQKELDALKVEIPIAIAKFKNSEQLDGTNRHVLRVINPILKIVDNEVVTSHGARVPLKEALSSYKKLVNKLDLKGERVGHFTINHVNDLTVRIGCHTIEIKELHDTFSNYLLKEV